MDFVDLAVGERQQGEMPGATRGLFCQGEVQTYGCDRFRTKPFSTSTWCSFKPRWFLQRKGQKGRGGRGGRRARRHGEEAGGGGGRKRRRKNKENNNNTKNKHYPSATLPKSWIP
eukprot:8219838-Pyramimonas_sp.AAC.1